MPDIKICIDAGHYGDWNSNRNVSPVYWESRMAWALHLLQKEELEKYEGISVITTRPNRETDLGLMDRGRKAKGCDLFISDHSNACDPPDQSVDRPVVIYPVSGAVKTLAQKLTDKIHEVMGTNNPGRIYYKWNSAHNADWYGVIRGAASVGVPGLILEHSFHTCDRSAAWLNSEANLRKLAEAEAAVIATYFGCKKKEEEITMTKAELDALLAQVKTDAKNEALSALRKEFPVLWSERYKAALDALKDNDAGKWSKEAREWITDEGLIAGVGNLPDGTPNYAWEQPLTREQFAVIEYRKRNGGGV